ncbi:MAG: hypothetical protein JWO19_3695 [Bryobacterales bacterium]|nr:hypothetical protein [Bryobacterales bacterium]
MAVANIDKVERGGADATGGTRVAGSSQCGRLQRHLLRRILWRMKADLAMELEPRSHFLLTFRH